jgi:hypothetical protein
MKPNTPWMKSLKEAAEKKKAVDKRTENVVRKVKEKVCTAQ